MPSIWDRIQQGLDRVVGVPEGVSPGAESLARSRGLIALGTRLLQAGGPQAQQQGTLANLGAAIQGAQPAAAAGAQEARQNELLQRRNALMQRFQAGDRSAGTLLNLFQDLVALGDNESARTIGEVIKSMGGDAAGSTYDIDLGDRRAIVDRATGQILRYVPKGEDPAGRADRTPQNVRAFRGLFQTGARDYRIRAEAYRNIRSAAEGDPSGSKDLALINSYQRLIDPGAAVREGDVSLILGSASVPQRVKAEIANWTKGELLSPEVRQQLVESARQQAVGSLAGFQNYLADYRRLGESLNLDVDDITENYFEGLGLAPPGADPSDLRGRFENIR